VGAARSRRHDSLTELSVRTFAAIDLSFPPDPPYLIDLVTALLDDFGPAAIHETGPDGAPAWRVFFGTSAIRDLALTALTRACGAHGLTAAAVDVPDEDWAARSQAGLRAVRVGRIIVAPPWDVPDHPGPDEAVVIIQPSMGFGTGHHETTRLCLALMQEIDYRGRRVLDVGTGSGVLALAAAALGAESAVGIDFDPDAVGNALENLALNPSLSRAATIRFIVTDLRAARARTGTSHSAAADIVLANLTGTLLVAAAPDLLAHASPGASMILSGFQHHETAAVLAAFAGGTELVARRAEGDWEAVLLDRSGESRTNPAAGGGHASGRAG
jgi:ribosomal protein L11 methyltransferase